MMEYDVCGCSCTTADGRTREENRKIIEFQNSFDNIQRRKAILRNEKKGVNDE